MEVITKQDLLTPPDPKRCQVDVPNGTNFMTLGGDIGGTVRCKNKPSVIAYEVLPGDDGLCGAMSICPTCLAVFQKRMGPKVNTHYRFEEVK